MRKTPRLCEGLGTMSAVMDWLRLLCHDGLSMSPTEGEETFKACRKVFAICALHKLFTLNELVFSLSYKIRPAVSDRLQPSSSSQPIHILPLPLNYLCLQYNHSLYTFPRQLFFPNGIVIGYRVLRKISQQ